MEGLFGVSQDVVQLCDSALKHRAEVTRDKRPSDSCGKERRGEKEGEEERRGEKEREKERRGEKEGEKERRGEERKKER